MSDSNGRRRFLKYALAFLGGSAATFAGLHMLPSYRRIRTVQWTGRRVVDIDIGRLKAGEILTNTVDHLPIYILKRSAETIAFLESDNPRLRDNDSSYSQQPENAQNRLRSVRPDIFVTYALCTHLGCVPGFSLDNSQNDIAKKWLGGYFVCPCDGAVYDAAGRVSKGVPAPLNLPVPNYEFLDTSTIRIYDSYPS